MECGCIESDSGDGEPIEKHEAKIVKARKEHKCQECGSIISKGDEYERVTGYSEGVFCHKTCTDCLSARGAFYCKYGYSYGMIWEDLQEHLSYYEDGDCLSKALLKCTEVARAKISDIIEESTKDATGKDNAQQ